jgi:hypothetical protein
VLDFGIAKILEARGSDSAVVQAPTLTETGAVVGTAYYMSPEQARGEEVTRRSDVWAFGVILFEMPTGTRAFAGATRSDVLAAILRATPDWSALPPATPASIIRLVRRCLARDPKARLHDVGDARLEIEDVERNLQELPAQPASARPDSPRGWRRAALGIAAIVGLAVVGAASGWIGSGLRRGPAVSSPLPAVAFLLTLPQGETLVEGYAALSSDGQQLVYGAVRNGQANLYLRKLNRLEPVLLPETRGARQPIFSPDGESIAFAADGALKVLRLSGGPATTIAPVNNLRGASWGDDDRNVYAPDVEGGLFRVSSRGGAPEQLTEVDKTTRANSHRFPHVLPGAGAIVFMVSDGQRAGTVSALDLRSRRRVDNLATGYGLHYLPSGHLTLMNSNGQSSLLPFDASNLRVLGPAITLQETPRIGFGGQFQGAAASNGTLAFVPYALPIRSFPT